MNNLPSRTSCPAAVMQEDLDASEIARLKRTIASLEEDNEQLRAEKDAKESPR